MSVHSQTDGSGQGRSAWAEVNRRMPKHDLIGGEDGEPFRLKCKKTGRLCQYRWVKGVYTLVILPRNS